MALVAPGCKKSKPAASTEGMPPATETARDVAKATDPGKHPSTALPAPVPVFDPAARIKGTIAVDEAMKKHVKKGDVVFVVARQVEPDGSSILGVKKLVVDKFPIAFEMDGHDAMLPGTAFAGKVLLTVRVDKDGEPTTKNPGDVIGAARAEIPSDNVQITLDTLTK